MIRLTCWLASLSVVLSGSGAVAGRRVVEGARCEGAVGGPTPARAVLLARLHLVREHGCSRSSETTSLAAEIRLELKGDTARVTIESFESLGGGPSPGRFRQGARDFFTRSTRRRWIYTGATHPAAGAIVVELKTRESSEDLAGGESFTGQKQDQVAAELSCTPAAIGVGVGRAGRREQVACRSVWLCRGLRELIPMTYESMSELAAGALVDEAFPLAVAPGLEVSASSRMGRPTRSYRTARVSR